jgi:hypothetical protein
LAEVFGYPAEDNAPEAVNGRKDHLCPFDNHGNPKCTKVSVSDPLGVCSLFDTDGEPVVICPIRLQQDWMIARDAAAFFFPPDTRWERFREVTLKDGTGQPAGDVDHVLVSYDERGAILDFGSVEVQAVYISGNIRNPFRAYMNRPRGSGPPDWNGPEYPRPDYLSSSRKRLVPQLLFKGSIFKAWGKKQAVILNRGFFGTLPDLPKVSPGKADMIWLIYDLVRNPKARRFELQLHQRVYTEFAPALDGIGKPVVPPPTEFRTSLQAKLNEVLARKTSKS